VGSKPSVPLCARGMAVETPCIRPSHFAGMSSMGGGSLDSNCRRHLVTRLSGLGEMILENCAAR
jgi:hypothetical protein